MNSKGNSPHLPPAVCYKAHVVSGQKVVDAQECVANASVLVSSSGQAYELVRQVKKTIYGNVFFGIAVHKSMVNGPFIRSNIHVAIKMYETAMMSRHINRMQENPIQEIQVVQYLSKDLNEDSTVLGQIETCADDQHLYFIMPWVEGDEMFDRIADGGRFNESEARPFFLQMMEGLLFLHLHGVAHRDMSLENMLYNSATGRTTIIDMGMSIFLPNRLNGQQMKRGVMDTKNEQCGKANYMPPEAVQGDYYVDPFAGDIWSAGVCLLFALLGFPPMESASDLDQRYAFITQGRLKELAAHWEVDLSDEVIDLVQSMLRVNPEDRATWQQIFSHPWLRAAQTESIANLSSEIEARRVTDYDLILKRESAMMFSVCQLHPSG